VKVLSYICSHRRLKQKGLRDLLARQRAAAVRVPAPVQQAEPEKEPEPEVPHPEPDAEPEPEGQRRGERSRRLQRPNLNQQEEAEFPNATQKRNPKHPKIPTKLTFPCQVQPVSGQPA